VARWCVTRAIAFPLCRLRRHLPRPCTGGRRQSETGPDGRLEPPVGVISVPIPYSLSPTSWGRCLRRRQRGHNPDTQARDQRYPRPTGPLITQRGTQPAPGGLRHPSPHPHCPSGASPPPPGAGETTKGTGFGECTRPGESTSHEARHIRSSRRLSGGGVIAGGDDGGGPSDTTTTPEPSPGQGPIDSRADPPPLRSPSLAQVLPPDGGEQETPDPPWAN